MDKKFIVNGYEAFGDDPGEDMLGIGFNTEQELKQFIAKLQNHLDSEGSFKRVTFYFKGVFVGKE